MTSLGDVDGDSVLDLAVGAPLHDTAVPDSGAVWTLLLNADGSVKGASTFDPTQVGFHPREDDFFGSALASSGDLDGNGEVDLIVGSPGDDGSPQFGDDNGVIWTASLAADGSPSSQARLLQGQIGIHFLHRRDAFGALVVSLPDMNADGVPDLAVGHGDYFRVWVFHQEGVARIEFETGDDFLAPLANGAEVSSTAHFGRVLEVDGYPTLGPSAAAFDSTPGGPNALGKDPDLLVGRGRVLILQEKPDHTVPGIYDVPDDDRFGGDFRFTFAGREVELLSLVLIDIDPAPGQGALVTLTDAEARERIYTVPAGFTEDIAIHGPPGYRTLDLTTLAPQAGFVASATATEKPGFDPERVVRLDVHLASSGALDGLVYDPYP